MQQTRQHDALLGQLGWLMCCSATCFCMIDYPGSSAIECTRLLYCSFLHCRTAAGCLEDNLPWVRSSYLSQHARMGLRLELPAKCFRTKSINARFTFPESELSADYSFPEVGSCSFVMDAAFFCIICCTEWLIPATSTSNCNLRTCESKLWERQSTLNEEESGVQNKTSIGHAYPTPVVVCHWASFFYLLKETSDPDHLSWSFRVLGHENNGHWVW